jgi:two-component sensor histidine kinase
MIIGLQAIIIALASSGIHVAFRYRRMKDIQTRIAQEVSQQLATNTSKPQGYNEAAETIRRLKSFQKDYFPYVHIMRWDDTVERLRVVGGAGKNPRLWANILTLRGEGVTGSAFATGEAKLYRDVTGLPAEHYKQVLGYEEVRSELAVPIKYRCQTIGVLDVQSPRANEFDKNDKALLTIVANGLGVAFGTELTIEKAYRSAQRALEAGTDIVGTELGRLKIWFEQIVDAAAQFLDVDQVILFRLAPGTSYPLITPLVKPLVNSSFPGESYWPIPRGSSFWFLLQQWEPAFDVKFSAPARGDIEPDGWARHFMSAVGLTTIAFLPIGLDEPLGALFLGYKRPKVFGDVDKLALITFASAIELSYRRVAPNRARPQQFGSPVHEALAPANKIVTDIKALAADSANPATHRRELLQIAEDVQQLRKQANLAAMGYSFDPDVPLSTLLQRVIGQLQTHLAGNVAFQLNGAELLHDEDPLLRATLYKVAHEAMTNAVMHGGPRLTLVTVRFEYTEEIVCMIVSDDGVGLTSECDQSGQHGIFYWRKLIRKEFQGRLNISNRPDGGVSVVLNMPLCPWPRSGANNDDS